MSDFPADYADRINMREQIARIDRNQAEIQKLFAEATKLNSEATKLNAEGNKLSRDRILAPFSLAVTSLGAGAALFAAAQALLRIMGQP